MRIWGDIRCRLGCGRSLLAGEGERGSRCGLGGADLFAPFLFFGVKNSAKGSLEIAGRLEKQDLKRSLAVTLIGIVVASLLVSLGTWVVLSHSPTSKAFVTGAPHSSEPFDIWLAHFGNMVWTVVGLVCVPTALLVGLLVGLFSNCHKTSFAIAASFPAWAPPLFTSPRIALMSAVIAGIAVLGAWLSKWVSARIHHFL
jgi:hypothetical protein